MDIEHTEGGVIKNTFKDVVGSLITTFLRIYRKVSRWKSLKYKWAFGEVVGQSITVPFWLMIDNGWSFLRHFVNVPYIADTSCFNV